MTSNGQKKYSSEELAHRAIAAKQRAIPKYSQFYVGAALLTRDGKIYEAGNIESSSYGLTVCAERIALFKALSEGEREFDAIAIAADTDDFTSPCGACRQVVWDFARNIKIILVNKSGEIREHQLADLLPEAFDDAFL